MTGYLVRASALEGFDELVRHLGGDPDPLRRAQGLQTGPLAPDSWISYRAFIDLLESAAASMDCPHFGLSLSRRQDIGILGTVGFVIREAPDVRTALQELSQYLTLHNQGAEVSLMVDGDTAQLSFRVKLPGHVRVTQQLDLVLGVGVNIMRLLCGRQWHPLAVYLAHAEPVDRSPYRRLFDCPLHFDAEMGAFLFRASDLQKTISSADSDLHDLLAGHLEQIRASFPDSYPDQIRYLIRQALYTGDCSVERIASYLSVTPRTLQRRLRAEGTSYKELLEDVRYDMATRYLLDSNSSLTVLSSMLGYSELSAFSNAFKLKTGLSPRNWRVRYAR